MFKRRKLLKGALATVAAAGFVGSDAFAIASNQIGPISAGVDAAIADAQANQLLDIDTMEAALPSSNDYDETLFKTLKAIDELESGATQDPRRWLILNQLYADLSRVNETVRELAVDEGQEAAPAYQGLRLAYEKLFETCVVRSEQRDVVNWYVRRLSGEKGILRYRRVEEHTGVPWFFIGIVHALEASFNFQGHLHNGDPLTARTRQVPRWRPRIWMPPNDWESSAIDALSEVSGNSDWSVPHMLYLLEGYNGYGYQRRKLNSPYLWSFSNHFTKGKYVRDGVFDPNAISKQCGAAVMLKVLSEANLIPR